MTRRTFKPALDGTACRRARALGTVAAALALAASWCAAPPAASAYGWPVEPFGAQHPVRGGFEDPRFHAGEGVRSESFHFGVDISAPDGTPVYAVAPGTAVRRPGHVLVRGRSRTFGYWHVASVVRSGRRVRLHQLLGYVLPGWGHVHLAESIGGVWVNPLRPGALTPYVDTTAPVVASVQAVTPDGGAPLDADAATGTIGLVADVYDPPPLPPPPPWQGARLAPASVRWRLVRDGSEVIPWDDTAHLGWYLLPGRLYDLIYAPGTYQNKPNRPGRYLFWLDHAFDRATLAPGAYDVEVEAADAAGNVGRGSLRLVVPG